MLTYFLILQKRKERNELISLSEEDNFLNIRNTDNNANIWFCLTLNDMMIKGEGKDKR